VRLAVSEQAAVTLFGQAGRPWHTMPCGVDLAAFVGLPPRAEVRATLGLPANAFVIGHVGRMVEEKNHRLLIEITAALVARQPQSHLLLIGDGPLRPVIAAQVARLGLAGHVTFLGARPDVPALLAALDVFVLPSRHEGFPVAAVEAQAAGLPCVLSNAIPPDVAVVAPLVRHVALASPADEWADAVLAAGGAQNRLDQAGALELLRRSPLSLAHNLAALTALYEAEAHHARRA
jgi:glycosyltransferase involved in cell wall biosynthesis